MSAGDAVTDPAEKAGVPQEKGQPGTRVVYALIGPAILAIVVYAAAETSWTILAVAGIIAVCAFAIGASLGFLFGIPTYLARSNEANSTDKASYQPNTNLTQVSDWLTKIIIGVSLVQFGQLTKSLGKLGDSLAPSLGGDDTGKSFGIAVVVAFFVIGFLAGYLYTRLRLQWAFAHADRGAFEDLVDAKLEQQKQADVEALTLASQQLDPAAEEPPREKLEGALAKASPAAKAQVLNRAQGSEQPSASPPRKRARVVLNAIDEPRQ
jgi:hypothetical protein